MSAPRVIAELVVTGIRVLGKATAAAGAQAVRSESTCLLDRHTKPSVVADIPRLQSQARRSSGIHID